MAYVIPVNSFHNWSNYICALAQHNMLFKAEHRSTYKALLMTASEADAKHSRKNSLERWGRVIVTQRPKIRRLSYWIFFIQSYSILHLRQSAFFRIKLSCSNWRYTRLIRTLTKVRKSNKIPKIVRVIIIICNNYFIILKLFRATKGFILYKMKQTTLKSGNKFTT